MITVLNLHNSSKIIPAKYHSDIPTIAKAINTKLYENDSEVKFVIDQIIKQINAEIEKPKATPKPKNKPATSKAEPKPKFKIGDSVQISDFGTEAKILSFRINRKKEIVYKCKYIAPINEIFEAKESELQLFKEWKPAPPKAEPKNKNTDKNPVPFANKPKSVSVATAIANVLTLDKFKKIKPMAANMVYKLFKDDTEIIQELTEFQYEILKSLPYEFAEVDSWEIMLQSKGKDFINAVNGRLESLRNQKYNYAMFDGLTGQQKTISKGVGVATTKKRKTKKTKKPLNGLVDIVTNVATSMIADKVINTKPDAPTKANENSLAGLLQKKANAKHEYYIIEDKNISRFLGNIEKKQKESVAITLAGGQGSMKTRLCFQLMNAFAQNYKVGHASIEEHPESALYLDKVHQYCNDKALHNISAPEINSIDDVHKLVKENDVIVIDSFSKLQEMQKGCELDKDFRKAYNGKLFIIIYQLTSDGKMRGGSKSQFDGDCIGFIEKKPNYKENYVYWDKNRYNKEPELKFNIYRGKIQHDEQPEIKTTTNNVQPKENDVFSFKIN